MNIKKTHQVDVRFQNKSMKEFSPAGKYIDEEAVMKSIENSKNSDKNEK